MRPVLFAVAICLVSQTPIAQDRSTPEAAVRSFLDAFSKGDVKAAAAGVKGSKPSSEWQSLSAQIKKTPATFTLADVKSVVNGDQATVTAQVTTSAGGFNQSETVNSEVALVKEGEAWLIVPDVSKAENNSRPDIVNALAYVLTDSQVFLRARDAARQTACISNVKQVSLATLMFLQDYDEKFKLKAATYKKSVMPYIKNESVFKCPADTAGGVAYSINANLVGISVNRVRQPAMTVMVYEGKNGRLDFRHNGRAVVGYVDGHTKAITPDAAKKLRWKP